MRGKSGELSTPAMAMTSAAYRLKKLVGSAGASLENVVSSSASPSNTGSTSQVGQSTILSCFSPRLRNRYRAYSRALMKRGLLPVSYLEPIPEDRAVSYGSGKQQGPPTKSKDIPVKTGSNNRGSNNEEESKCENPESSSKISTRSVSVEKESPLIGPVSRSDNIRNAFDELKREDEELEMVDEHFGFLSSAAEDRWTHHRKDWILLVISVIVALVSLVMFMF